MLRIFVGTIILVVILYAILCVALYVFQRSLIYFPQPTAPASTDAVMKFDVPDAQLRLTVKRVSGAKALLYLGGNAEDVAANLPQLSQAFPDRAVYLLHYRGFGGSSGKPTEKSLHADALALFDKIQAEHPDVLVIGRSLGSGVAVRLASIRPVSRLVLVTPYDSLQELAVAQFPYVPVRWMLSDKFESWRYAPQVKAPTLILEAEKDEVIPNASTQLLLTRFADGVATLKRIEGVGHGSISESPGYVAALNSIR